jgi:hypothetical protein
MGSSSLLRFGFPSDFGLIPVSGRVSRHERLSQSDDSGLIAVLACVARRQLAERQGARKKRFPLGNVLPH